MQITIYNDQRAVSINLDSVRSLINGFLTYKNVTCDEVIVHFVDVPAISEIHNDFFDDPTPTDCISFPMDEDENIFPRILGEIFVCPDIARDYVQEHGGELNHELSLYVIHGLLHLLGYDDLTDSDAKTMRYEEAKALQHLENCLLQTGSTT